MARTLLLAALIVLAATATLPASALHCVPARDEGARTLETDAATFYARTYPNQGYQVVELWEESNGIPGLQYSSGMACGAYADRLVASRCVGFCPLPL